jgi:hypothetical protein
MKHLSAILVKKLALEQQCDHDPKTVHHWCLDCCENFQEKKYPREWDDLD